MYEIKQLDEGEGIERTLFVPSVVGLVCLLLRGICNMTELPGWISICEKTHDLVNVVR